MKRTDYLALKIMKKLLIQYGKKFIAEGDTADKSTLDTYYQLLFSWFFIRNIIIYTGCHLECASATLPKDTVFFEFIDESFCLKMPRRCHMIMDFVVEHVQNFQEFPIKNFWFVLDVLSLVIKNMN